MAVLNTREEKGLENSEYQGFSIDAYRNANKVDIYLNKGDAHKIVSAFYKGNFDLDFSMQVGNASDWLLNLANGFLGDVAKVALSASTGISGAFCANFVPYLKSVNPIQFTLPLYFPIDDGKTIDYKKNIVQPINTLLHVTLPSVDNSATKFIEDTTNAVKDFVKDAFSGVSGSIWDGLEKATQGTVDSFTQIKAYSVPEQMKQYMVDGKSRYSSIEVQIGNNIRITNVLITSIKVSLSPLIYTDGTNTYPAYAEVQLVCQSRDPVSVEQWSLSSDEKEFTEEYIKLK